MSLTLYRKYRPKTFAEVEGQTHIVRTLQGALSSGRIGHAYLFCGPRGTGKTTLARLFAKALNCEKRGQQAEPCNQCSVCIEINTGRSLDLIEIDAASNRGIDEIRNLRDSARVAAASSTYKIFIIDELHMLTPPAFNALLKTLEEPPGHIIFILATTEPHKVLETILSRVQRFDFKKITPEQIEKKLLRVAKAEGVNIELEAISALASVSGGSLRDAESSLAKLIAFAGNKISTADTAEILGIVSLQTHEQLLSEIIGNQNQEAIKLISQVFEAGVDMDNFTKQFIAYVRTKLLNSINSNTPLATAAATDSGRNESDKLVRILNTFINARAELKHSPIPQLPLELAILELTNGQLGKSSPN